MAILDPEPGARRTSFTRAYIPAAVTMLIGLLVSAWLFQSLRARDYQTTFYAFGFESQIRVRAIERILHAHVDRVDWLAAMLGAVPPAERAALGRHTSSLHGDDSETLQLYWAPRTVEGQSESFRVIPSGKSKAGNALAGFDLLSEPEVRQYANFSRQRDKTFIVANSPAAREVFGPSAVLAIRSVWTDDKSGQRTCIGFALGAFEVGHVADYALRGHSTGVVNMDIFDAFAMPGAMNLYQWRTETEGTTAAPLSERSMLGLAGIHRTIPVELGGTRRWVFVCTPTPEYVAEAHSWVPWLGLAAGLCLTAFLTNHFLAQIRQRRKAEQLVLQRTTELRDTNARLSAEIAERKRFEAEREDLLALLEQSNDSLQRVNGELARSNEELQEFAVVASHDLKEPLRKITVLADTLRNKLTPESNGAGEYVGLIHEGAAKMMGRIASVLDVSRVRTHGKPFEPVDLGEAIADVIDDLRVRIDETEGRVEAAGPFPIIEADPGQIRRLLQNLIENGLKYARPDVPPHIIVSAVEENSGQVTLSVEDNGVGIPASAMSRIFSLYQRADGDGTHEGSGVGLAVCRKIVERHNGAIHAEPAGEFGTRFAVRLPTEQTRSESL